MPLSLEPSKRCAICLRSDKDKPAEVRPTFYVRSLSMRDAADLSAKYDEIRADKSVKKLFDSSCELFRQYLLGWENMGPMIFGETPIEDFVTYGEVNELILATMANNHISDEEKKS